jgi:hypothetical protein
MNEQSFEAALNALALLPDDGGSRRIAAGHVAAIRAIIADRDAHIARLQDRLAAAIARAEHADAEAADARRHAIEDSELIDAALEAAGLQLFNEHGERVPAAVLIAQLAADRDQLRAIDDLK